MNATKYFILIIDEEGKVNYIEKGEHSDYAVGFNFTLGVSRPALFDTVEEIRSLLDNHPEFNKRAVTSGGLSFPPPIYHNALRINSQRRSSKGRVQICTATVIDEFETETHALIETDENVRCRIEQDYRAQWQQMFKERQSYYKTDECGTLQKVLQLRKPIHPEYLREILSNAKDCIEGKSTSPVTALSACRFLAGSSPFFNFVIHPYVDDLAFEYNDMLYRRISLNRASVTQMLEVMIAILR